MSDTVQWTTLELRTFKQVFEKHLGRNKKLGRLSPSARDPRAMNAQARDLLVKRRDDARATLLAITAENSDAPWPQLAQLQARVDELSRSTDGVLANFQVGATDTADTIDGVSSTLIALADRWIRASTPPRAAGCGGEAASQTWYLDRRDASRIA